MPTPIRTNSKNINVIPLNIIDFLAFILFNNNLVSKASGSYALHTLSKRLLNINLSSRTIKIVSSDTDD